MKKRQTEIHDFYCSECGFYTPLARRCDKKKANGHLKKLYCPHCRKEVNFIETINKEILQYE